MRCLAIFGQERRFLPVYPRNMPGAEPPINSQTPPPTPGSALAEPSRKRGHWAYAVAGVLLCLHLIVFLIAVAWNGAPIDARRIGWLMSSTVGYCAICGGIGYLV